MTKDEIVKMLEANDSTILSFPNRGEWGDNKYRGNCSGWIQAFLIWKYMSENGHFAELFAGSGTGYDVCRDMGISYTGADINPTPVRPGILQVDAVNDDVPDQFYGADMIFMHPAYSAMINIPYTNSQYSCDKELEKSDLGRMSYDDCMIELNRIIVKYFAALDNGGRMAVLVGDIRRSGKFRSMFSDMVKPGELEQVIIKAQHNVSSAGSSYARRNFVPIAHEYIAVMKKLAPYVIDFTLPRRYEQDVRDSKSATWKSVVYQTIKNLGGKASLQQIYDAVEGHRKTLRNEHWKEKIRQTCQLWPDLFRSCERGVWQLA